MLSKYTIPVLVVIALIFSFFVGMAYQQHITIRRAQTIIKLNYDNSDIEFIIFGESQL